MRGITSLLVRGLSLIVAVAVVLIFQASSALAQTLQPGASLDRGTGIYSSNGMYYFVMQDDGNLVLYRSGGPALWATGTDGVAIRHAVMQDDGNLVLYDYAGAPRWASNTAGQPGSYLVVQDDGNVVIYRPDFPLWASNTQESNDRCDTRTILAPGDELLRGDARYSPNGRYYFVMQDDGNLVLYRTGGPALWATGTHGIAIRHAVMQTDGNLVLYDYAGAPRWASNTHGHAGAFLDVQCDGNVVIYLPNVPIWATNTVQP